MIEKQNCKIINIDQKWTYNAKFRLEITLLPLPKKILRGTVIEIFNLW